MLQTWGCGWLQNICWKFWKYLASCVTYCLLMESAALNCIRKLLKENANLSEGGALQILQCAFEHFRFHHWSYDYQSLSFMMLRISMICFREDLLLKWARVCRHHYRSMHTGLYSFWWILQYHIKAQAQAFIKMRKIGLTKTLSISILQGLVLVYMTVIMVAVVR